MTQKINTSDEACAMACMIVSNPQGKLRTDGDGWQRRVNDLIRALKDERNGLREDIERLKCIVAAHVKPKPKDLRKLG